jgi:hypothetical protein
MSSGLGEAIDQGPEVSEQFFTGKPCKHHSESKMSMNLMRKKTKKNRISGFCLIFLQRNSNKQSKEITKSFIVDFLVI